MSRIWNIISIIFMIISTNYICPIRGSWCDGEFYFDERTVASLELGENDISENLSSTIEDRQQLCYYAKMEAELAYIDHNYVPEWKQYEPQSEANSSMNFGMYCATLPTVHLVAESFQPYIQITFFESRVADYVFDRKVIDAVSVRPSDELTGQHANPLLAQLSIEDRRNLCVAAQKFVNIVFLDHNVAEGKEYEFGFGNMSESHFAFVCPATPHVYIICPEMSGKKLKLIRHRSQIDDYEFKLEKLEASSVDPEPEGKHSSLALSENSLALLGEEDRLIVCAVARAFAALPFKDIDGAKVGWYTFSYPNQPEQLDVALLCPAVPSVYIRSDTSSEKTKVKLTLLQNPFHEFRYNTEFFWRIWDSRPREDKDEKEFAQMIEEFPLTALNEEKRWQICTVAITRSVNFVVSLISKYIVPQVVDFDQLSDDEEFPRSTGVALRCSLRPELYLRMEKSDEKRIKVALIREQYDALLK